MNRVELFERNFHPLRSTFITGPLSQRDPLILSALSVILRSLSLLQITELKPGTEIGNCSTFNIGVLKRILISVSLDRGL